MARVLFFISLGIVFYSYIGYGILVFLLVKLKHLLFQAPPGKIVDYFEPEITLVVAAFNEGDYIEMKIRNSLELDYPPGKLHWIFITDGSSDNTPDIIRNHPQIRLLHQPERKGKVAAMNRAIRFVETPYTIFSDANTLLNPLCVREIVKNYRDEKVGGVSGEKKIMMTDLGKVSGTGEGIYWKYESLLKKLDSDLNSVVGAAGELFSVKTALFYEAPEDTIIEDFVQSMKICMDGYVIRYEPNAYAIEHGSASMRDEQKRKVRIAAGAFQAMIILKGLFNVFRYPVLSFQFISHRILRWTLCPLCLPLCFVTNAWLAFTGSGGFYFVFFLAQTVFYAVALAGWILANRNVKIKILYIPYYFLFMNLSVFIGFYRWYLNKQSSVWEKSARHNPA
jgi:cellulose synthase/poly-beta-1,6-N-acetylglucosamine synthase-like glycosyltransferase